MQSLGDLDPLTRVRNAYRKSRATPSYLHLERDDSFDDLEKMSTRHRRVSDSSDNNSVPSSASSRATSDSFTPMLRKHTTRRHDAFHMYQLPARIIRYLCFGLMATVILFILSLVQMSAVSSKQVEVSNVAATVSPPPPQWEGFPFMHRYYGGIRSLVAKEDNVPEYPVEDSQIMKAANTSDSTEVENESGHVIPQRGSETKSMFAFNPYPYYQSEEYRAEYGVVEECFLDAKGTIRIPKLRAFSGIPSGMADPIVGSHTVLGLRNDICFDRFGRLGPYGYGYSARHGGVGAGLHGDREGAESVWEDEPEVDYRKVNWAEAQAACLSKNSDRFKPFAKTPDAFGPKSTMDAAGGLAGRDSLTGTTPSKSGKEPNSNPSVEASQSSHRRLPRTAVVIRTWSDYNYSEEDLLYLRSLIAELSLHSSGEYTIHFLIHVRDENLQIWAEDDIYQEVLARSLPEEFRGMGTLWMEKQMGLVYSGLEESFFRELPVHGVYRSTYMPMQYFAKTHPEYDFFWHWEMDERYTGHYYHLFDQLDKWTKAQPRKGLWERNSRFYVPSVHGSWEEFSQMTKFQTEYGTDNPNNMWSGLGVGREKGQKGDQPVWGPEKPLDDGLLEEEVIPPTSYDADKYEWGVGEDADFITLNPLFDPDGTSWLLKDDVTGYNTTQSSPPRRAAIVTASRLSRRLLMTMHHETALKRHSMFSEMWPGSVALHYGFKAVYAPHPVYIDRRWPTKYLATTFNAGRNGAAGGARTSVFGDREHNFMGTTWYYNAGFAPNLWIRWLGLRSHNDGGEEWELENEGRMCLPPMLLHPMKRADLIIEELPDQSL